MSSPPNPNASRRHFVLGLSCLALAACSSESEPGPGSTAAEGDYVPPNDSESWETADPTETGWSPDGLAQLLAVAEANSSTTFMMLSGGRVLVEAYFAGANADTLQDIASVQKSVTSTLLGLARDRGLLDFDDKVSDYLAAGWTNAGAAAEAAITLRHLMTHSSGLDPNTLKKGAEPGTEFDYNTNAYQKLRSVLEVASGSDINSLSREWMFDAIGITGSWIERPGLSDPVGEQAWGLRLRARDMARFGLLAQRAGRWGNQQITSAGWFAEAWTPCAVKKDYGLLWWLQGKGPLGAKGAPMDLVSGLGAGDQKLYVVPSMDLVAVRQGSAALDATEAESNFDFVLAKAIADARI